jgi:hypothetical protein
MPRALRPRKVVGGQVSPEEYETIARALRASGFQSVSAGVRTVLLAYAVTHHLHTMPPDQLAALVGDPPPEAPNAA